MLDLGSFVSRRRFNSWAVLTRPRVIIVMVMVMVIIIVMAVTTTCSKANYTDDGGPGNWRRRAHGPEGGTGTGTGAGTYQTQATGSSSSSVAARQFVQRSSGGVDEGRGGRSKRLGQGARRLGVCSIKTSEGTDGARPWAMDGWTVRSAPPSANRACVYLRYRSMAGRPMRPSASWAWSTTAILGRRV